MHERDDIDWQAGLRTRMARRASRRARWWVWLQRVGLVLALAMGALAVVQAPYDVVRPAPGIDVRRLLVAPPMPTGARGGELLIPVVDIHRAKWVEVLFYRAVGGARIEPHDDIGAGIALQQHGAVSAHRLFVDSRQIGTLVAARLAKAKVDSLGQGVRISAVGRKQARSPLQSGDVIVAVGSQQVHTFDELRQVIEQTPVGAVLKVELADGRDLTLPPVSAASAHNGILRTPNALGVAAVETDRPTIGDDGGLRWRTMPELSGPSSGLAFALVAWERFAGRPLAPGKIVVVTGEIGSDGGVYPVGGVEEKARAARSLHADILIVPRHNADSARPHAGDVRVVEVASVDEAVQLLS